MNPWDRIGPGLAAAMAAGGARPDPLAGLSDGFDGSSLDPAWTEYAGAGAYDVSTVSGGQYTIRSDDGGPNIPGSFWFGGFQGLLTYKTIEGDFVATARVHVTNAAGNARPSTAGFRQAGIGAHDPDRSTVLNYVDVSIGSSDDDPNHTAEWKSTLDGTASSGTTFGFVTFDNGVGEIDGWVRLTRQGSTFTMEASADGQSWTTLNQIERADLPATLQVGPIIYSNQDVADVMGAFDFVAFATP